MSDKLGTTPHSPRSANPRLMRHTRTLSRVQGSGFRVQGSGPRVQGSGFRVQGSGFRVQGSGFRVRGSWFGVQGAHPRLMRHTRTLSLRPPFPHRALRPRQRESLCPPRLVPPPSFCSVQGSGFRVQGLGVRVQGLGLKIESLGVRV